MVKTPEQVIAHSIWYDFNSTSNARRIIDNLRRHGYAIVPAETKVNLPELKKMFAGHAVSAEEAEHWFNEAFERGRAEGWKDAAEREAA